MNVVVIVLLAEPAPACSILCLDLIETISPAFEDVPTNAVIRTIGHEAAPEPKEIYEDGVLRGDVVNELARHGAFFVLTQRTLEPFRPGATVDVRSTDPNVFDVAESFSLRVGQEADHTPPTWDGLYRVNQSRRYFGSCGTGPSWGHTFEWVGMTDDVWDASELLVVAEPHDPRHAEFAGGGAVATVELDACADDDPTLKGVFHRAYHIFVEDGSGNRIGPFEVNTRHCGCAGVPSPAVGMGGLLLVAASLAAYCSRARRIPARRPTLPAFSPRLLEG